MRRLPVLRCAGLLGLASLLCSCTTSTPTLTQVGAFATASEALAQHSQDAFVRVNGIRVERNIYDLAADPTMAPDNRMFAGLFDSAEGNALQVRLQLLEALGDYAGGLGALASADVRTDVDVATTRLHGALSSLSGNFNKATGSPPPSLKNLEFLSTAVNAIGASIVESRRRAAIREIVIATDPAVQTAAELLERELSPDSDMANLVRQSLLNQQGSVMQAYNTQRTRPESTFDARRAMLREVRDVRNAATHSREYFETVALGAAELRKAHAALLEAVKRDQFTSSELARSVGELARLAKSVKKFHKSLHPSE